MHERILIVEDDPDTLELLENYFERFGYQVEAAPLGSEAVARATAQPPELIILDIRLPDIDGYEVCRHLAAHARTARVPVIFLTEKRERDARIAGLQLGAVDYVSKPFDIHELRLRVENALRRAGFRPLTHPVTGLPGEDLAREQLLSLEGRGGWELTRVDVEGLDAFGELYGFVAGDDLLRAVGMAIQALAEEDAGPASFVAHLDAGSFILISGEGGGERIAADLAGRLPRIIRQFYPLKHLEAGPADGVALPAIEIYAGSVSSATVPAGGGPALLEIAHQRRRRIAGVPE